MSNPFEDGNPFENGNPFNVPPLSFTTLPPSLGSPRVDELLQKLIAGQQEMNVLLQGSIQHQHYLSNLLYQSFAVSGPRELDAAALAPPRPPAPLPNRGLFRSPHLYYNAIEARYYKMAELVVQNIYVLAPSGIQTTVAAIERSFPAPVLFTKFATCGITECAGLVSMQGTINAQPLTGTILGQAADSLLIIKDLVEYDLLKMGVPRYFEGDIVFGPTTVTNTDADNDHSFLIILEYVRLEPVDPTEVSIYLRGAQ